MDNIIVKRNRKINTITKKINKINKTREKETKSIDHYHENKVIYFKDLRTRVLEQKTKEILDPGTPKYIKKILQKEVNDIINREEEINYYCKIHDILDKYYSTKDENVKAQLTNKYCYILGIAKDPTEKYSEKYNCNNCESFDLVYSIEGIVCRGCGVLEKTFLAEDMSFSQITENPSVLIKKIHYQKRNYFQEILKSLQGGILKEVPEEILNNIKKELIIHNITETKQVNHKIIQRILKRLNYSKYYKYKHHIVRIITNQNPLSIPKPVEEIINHMFDLVETVWEHVKPEENHSIFSLQHILYKIFQILNLNEYLQYISLSKDRSKVIKNELLWESIVNYIVKNNLDDRYHYNINWRVIPIV